VNQNLPTAALNAHRCYPLCAWRYAEPAERIAAHLRPRATMMPRRRREP